MKYIRTESGYVGNKKDYMKLCGVVKKLAEKYGEEECDKIIKETDTIEELCDEFVMFRDGKPYAITPSNEHNARLAHDVWKDYRGAIWTDKGLIYVAKMNDKGELELL